MTKTNPFLTPATGRSAQVQRVGARILRGAADVIDVAAVVSALAVAVTSLFRVGPTWLQLSDFAVVVYFLAAYGLSQVLGNILGEVADVIDSDGSDGAGLDIGELLQDMRGDIGNGADLHQVLGSLRAGDVLGELTATFRALADAFAGEDDEDRAQILYATVLHLRNARDQLSPQDTADAIDARPASDLPA